MNELKGHIKLYRKIFNSKICPKRKYNRFDAWIYLLCFANWADGKWQGIVIKRGSYLTSQKQLAVKWGWSVSGVNKFLKFLKSENAIQYESTNQYTIIRIKNYNLYQSTKTKSETKSENKVKTMEKRSENEVKQYNKKNKNKKNKNTISKKDFASDKTFKKEIYDDILNKYQELRGIILKGKEFSPSQHYIKMMLESKRSPEDIKKCMEWLDESDEEWTNNWKMSTVYKVMPDFIAGNLEEIVITPSYAKPFQK